MQPETYYKQRLDKLKLDLKTLLKKRSTLAWLRFAAVVGIVACVYFLFPFGWIYVLAPGLLLLIVFTRLIFADLKNRSAIEHHDHLVAITEAELKALAHEYYQFADGKEFIPKEHFYANDLDIFGHASLYQYINRTGSEMGSMALAGWVSQPSDTVTILQRQAAIKELSTQNEWRQRLQALGAAKKIQFVTQHRLEKWFDEEDRFINNQYWFVLRYLLPVIILAVIALNIFDVVSDPFRNYFLLAFAFIAFYISKKVTPLHQQVSKMADELDVLSDSIQLIEQAAFKAPYLQQLQMQFRQQNGSASAKLKELKNILERLDMRYNIVVFIPLAILLQWDLQQVIALEKWKKENHKDVIEWFNALGSFEALNSLSTISFNHPEWCFPVFAAEHFFMEGKEIGHPLINPASRVNNNIKIDNNAELMLVTGSNMAGKSTYLRSIGINTILAMAGAPVCARYFCLSPVQIISSMRIADNLEENTSTFYAELKKLKTVIDKVNNNEKIFILLDEILRGTNSLDRHTGSVALIKQLIKHKAAAIIATHDVELAKMKEDHPANILNYHFDVQVSNDELYFDYQLKEGICTSLNASILMKKIGIEL